MKKSTLITLTLFLLSPFALQAEDGQHSLGFGVNYWQVIDDIDIDDIEDNGFSYLAAYRYDGGLLSLQAEVEVFPEDYAGAPKDVYSPQALVVLGESLFVAAGAGINYSDGEFADDPYYLLRAGLSLIGLGPFQIDFHATYLFTDAGAFDVDDIDTDTITLGAMIRFEL